MPDGNVMDFPEVLRVKGVMAKGFGIICKFPMVDHELSLPAKAIYALICSYAGNGTSTFPSREKIMHHLKIGKDKCSAGIKELNDQGYLIVSKRVMPNGQFASNVYEIATNPKRFDESAYESSGGSLTSSLSYTGMKKAGFGVIPRMVMMDERLSVTAKVLYAYLSSFVGGGTVAFPKTSLIQYHLGITQSTYQRHMQQLTKANYISMIQRHENGLLGANNYFLVDHPDEASVLSIQERRKMKKAVTGNPGKNDQIRQSKDTVQICQSEDTVNEVTDFQVSVYQVSVNQLSVPQLSVQKPAIINSSSKNSPPKISPSINRPTYWTDGLTKEEIIEILEQDHMPYQRRTDYKINISDESILYLMEIIADFAISGQNLKIHGVEHDRGEVLDRLMQLEVEDYEYIVRKVSAFQDHIKNLHGYYLVCMYSAKADRDMETALEIKRDIG